MKHKTATTHFDLPTALSPRQMIFTCSSVSYFFWSSSGMLLTSPAIFLYFQVSIAFTEGCLYASLFEFINTWRKKLPKLQQHPTAIDKENSLYFAIGQLKLTSCGLIMIISFRSSVLTETNLMLVETKYSTNTVIYQLYLSF